MANKKINQLVSKTAILSTDIFGIGDATTGQLFKKTIAELQAAIGGAVISVNGLVGTVVLDTDDIQELATPTNKYFTDARARGAISLTVTGNSGASTYSSGTGVLNVPTYTLAGLGGISATFLSGTSGISYNSSTGVISYSGTVYTDASIRALLSGSTGISYNSSTGAISYSGTVYTDSSVRALISMTTTGDSGASTYNNTTGVINVPNYTLAGLGGISLTSLSGGTGITYNNTTGAISYSGTVYTDASVRALISATGSVSYNNTTGVISLTSGNLTEATSSVLTITGGTGAVIGAGTSIQVKQATTSVSGFLSSTDWNTFNGKASALSGTTNNLAKFTSSSTIGDSGITDNGTTVTLVSRALSGTSGTFSSTLTASAFIPSGSSVPTNGMYLSAANNLNFSTNSVNRVNISSTGEWSFKGVIGGSLTALPQFYINSIGANYGLLQNLNSTTWSLGYGGSVSALGTSVLSWNDSGNVGIGTNAPQAMLSIAHNFNSATAATYANSNLANINAYEASSEGYLRYLDISMGSGDVGSAIRFLTATSNTATAERMRIDKDGLATFSSQVRATLFTIIKDSANRGGVFSYKDVTGSGADYGLTLLAQDGTGNGNIYFCPNGSATQAVSIRTSGNMLIGGTSDNGERLYVTGAIRATGTITANSDIILKKNLLKIENALEKVEQINGYTYELKADDSKRHGGVIAQEMEKVFPEIVNKGNDGILGVEYGNISALLIEAIKEQNTKIKNLETLLASK